MKVDQVEQPRARWSSRGIFIVACVGSAIGLGNVWRFPYLAYSYGGGAFLIPYFMFLMATGLPLMQAELALGRLRQKGDIEAFGSIHRRARGVGVISVIGGFSIVTYYSVIIAWSCIYFVGSFKPDLPWAKADCGDIGDVGYDSCIADPNSLPIKAANSYYYDTVMRYNSRNVEKGTATIINGPSFAGLLFAWIFCYFSIWKGVASVGQAVKLTVFLPWLLLGIMLIYASTLDGAGDGVKAYIGVWDMDVLKQGAVWSNAAGQIFFTLGATLGIMTAYGSYAPKNTDMFINNNIIGYVNCGTSVFAGFVIFSILGHMAHQQNQTLSVAPTLRNAMCESFSLDPLGGDYDPSCAGYDCSVCLTDLWDKEVCCGYTTTDTVASAGLGLAFVVYPAVMTLLPSAAGNIFSLCWFACLFLLGIDSMFAMVEGVATVITDTDRYKHLRKEIVAAVTCAIGFLVSITFATDIGLALLDTFDHYTINYALFLTGAAEAYVISWVWGWRETADKCGTMCARLLTFGYTGGCAIGVIVGGSIHYETAPGVNVGIGFGIGFAIFMICMLAAFVTRTNKEDGFKAWIDIWFFAGARNLSVTFKPNPKPWELRMYAVFYDFPIKYICPGAMLALVTNTAISDAQYDTGYGNYPKWMQVVVGGTILTLMCGSIVFFCLFPQFWDKLSPPAQALKDAHAENEANKKAEDGASGSSDMVEEYDDWGRKVVAPGETGL